MLTWIGVPTFQDQTEGEDTTVEHLGKFEKL